MCACKQSTPAASPVGGRSSGRRQCQHRPAKVNALHFLPTRRRPALPPARSAPLQAAAARRRRCALEISLSFRVISRPRALRQACVPCDAPARSISFGNGTAAAGRRRRTRRLRQPRVLRARRMLPSAGSRTRGRRGPRSMQQRRLQRRPVHAPGVLRAMGSRGARVFEVLRTGALVV